MSEAHPQDRAFHWLIGGMLAAVFVGLIVSSLYPVTSRRIWIDITGAGRMFTAWVFNTLPVGAIIAIGALLIFGLIALGVLLTVINWLRGLLA